MAGLLPFRSTPDHTPKPQTVFDGSDDRANAVFNALGSETARSIYGAFDGAPGPATQIADRVGTSLQNAQYHFQRLEHADLIAPVDTWYSAKEREVTVYAVTAEQVGVRVDGGSDARSTRSMAEAR